MPVYTLRLDQNNNNLMKKLKKENFKMYLSYSSVVFKCCNTVLESKYCNTVLESTNI